MTLKDLMSQVKSLSEQGYDNAEVVSWGFKKIRPLKDLFGSQMELVDGTIRHRVHIRFVGKDT
jgi:hypothetical protein